MNNAQFTLFYGDCLDYLRDMPDNYVDLIITSPPYNKKQARGKLVAEVKYENITDNMNEDEYQSWQIEVLNECYRVTKNNMFYNHKIRYQKRAIHPLEWLLKTKWILWQEIVWNRMITGNIRGWRFYHTDERIYWLCKSKPLELPQPSAQLSSVWSTPPARNNPHPAPFPLEIPSRIISAVTSPNQLVLDPFSGSATTAIAAKMLNRRFIGVEISPSYFSTSISRYHSSPRK